MNIENLLIFLELEMNKIVCNVCLRTMRMILTHNFSHDGAVERFNKVMAICDSYYAATKEI
jgi:hypothetical protein